MIIVVKFSREDFFLLIKGKGILIIGISFIVILMLIKKWINMMFVILYI